MVPQLRTPHSELRTPILAHPVPALFFLLGALVVAAAALQSLHRAVEDHRHLTTGSAQWIWCTRNVPKPDPVHFYAARRFSLPRVPYSAKAHVFGDPAWRLEVNGIRAGEGQQRRGDRLKTIELAPFLKQGENLLVIETESSNGVGAVLFSLDNEREENILVSDANWRVARDRREAERGGGVPAAVWGRPPMYPWGYPRE